MGRVDFGHWYAGLQSFWCSRCRRIPRSIALLAVWFGCPPQAAGLELVLPPVGTDVTYDYHAERPDLEVIRAAPPHEVLAACLTFAGDKYLRVTSEVQDLSLHVELVLRAEGILDSFERTSFHFDESLSLLRGDGSAFATSPKNSSVGYDDDRRDTYLFGWDFHSLSESTIHGLEWRVTPELATGALLPDAIGLDFRLSFARSIIVVPEPTAGVLLVICVFCGLSGAARTCRLGTDPGRSSGSGFWRPSGTAVWR